MKAVITSLTIGLTLFLWGCGDDTEETALVQIPILLENVTVEGTYEVNVTITGTGTQPIRTEQHLDIQTDKDKVYVTVDEVPPEGAWSVKIDMRRDINGKTVVYQGDGQLLFSNREVTNVSPITVDAVVHHFVATFELTSAVTLTEAGYLQHGHIIVDAGQSKDTFYGISVKWDWGDGEQTEYSQELTAEHSFITAGDYLVTLIVRNNAPVPETKAYQKAVSVAVQQEIRFETDGAVMHLIPAGEFEMGDHFGDGQSDERPVHTVYLDAFYMDETEVTNDRYEAFVEATGHRTPYHWENPGPAGHLIKPHFPVVYVSWHDAMAYAKWAGKRLPTEAEWEYAARGGRVGQRYPWGDEVSHDHANYSGEAERDQWYWPAPVKRFPQNDYGLYDMVGNVWEWCLDEYDRDFYATSRRNNPVAGRLIPLEDDFHNLRDPRVWRGGAWDTGPKSLTVSNRFKADPDLRVLTTGFRCVFPVRALR